MRLESVLGRLSAFLDLEPDKTELVLDVVDHDGLTLAALFLSILGGGVGTLELEIRVTLLEVLAAVGLQENGAIGGRVDLEGVREKLVSGNQVLQDRQQLDRIKFRARERVDLPAEGVYTRCR